MATAHEIAVITNSCVKAPVDQQIRQSLTLNERHDVYSSSTWQSKAPTREIFTEHTPHANTSHGITKTSATNDNQTFESSLNNLTDDEFYERLVALKKEHKKTLQLCESLYNEKLFQLKDGSRNYANPSLPTASVGDDFSIRPSYTDHVKDYSSSKSPMSQSLKVPMKTHGWINADGTPLRKEEEAALFQSDTRPTVKFYGDNPLDVSLDDTRISAHSKISDMWENFSVDDYGPPIKERPRSSSMSRISTTTTKHKIDKPKEKEWRHKITIPKPFSMTLRDANKTPRKTRAMVEVEMEREQREKEAELECQKKFKAKAVPAHVYMPLYDEINEEKETRKRYIREHSEELLRSQVKPFKFTQREEMKHYHQKQPKKGSLKSYDQHEKQEHFKANPYPAHIFDDKLDHQLKEEEEFRKIRVQMRSEKLLKLASLPPNMASRGQDYVDGKARQRLYAERAKKAGFTPDHKFKPHINRDMPDFDDLHRKYMKEVAQRKAAREATVCKPFNLRTERTSKEHKMYKEMEKSRKEFANDEPYRQHRRTRPHSAPRMSATAPLSTSMDAIPARLTKAAELRSSANKEKLQRKIQAELSELEAERKKRLNEERLKKTLVEKAMANDRTVTLSKDRNTKLKEYKETDRARYREYVSQLNEMKERVEKRPFLFERTAQENAAKAANKRYQDTLHRAGLDEDFVNIKGKAATGEAYQFSDDQVSEDGSYIRSSSNKPSVSKQYSEDYEERTNSEGELEEEA